MRRWWIVVALLLSVGVNVGVLATLAVHRLRAPAGPPVAGSAPMTPEIAPVQARRLARHLRLDREQRRSFVDLHRDFYRRTGPQRRRLVELRRQVRDELRAPRPDRRRLDRLIDETGEAAAAVDRAFAEHVLAIRDLLGPDQERAFLEVLDRLGRAGRRPPVRRPPGLRRPEVPLPGPPEGGGEDGAEPPPG